MPARPPSTDRRTAAVPVPLSFRAAPGITLVGGDDDGPDGAYNADVLAAALSPKGDGPAPVPDDLARRVAQRYGVDLDRAIVQEKASGRAGEVTRVPVVAPDGLPARFLLVGIGAGGASDLRRAGAALGRAARGRGRLATSLPAGRDAATVSAFVEGLVLGGHAPAASGLKNRADGQPVRAVTLLGVDGPGRSGTAGAGGLAAVRRGLLVAGTGVRSRDLAATPSSTKTPAWMADRAREAAAEGGLAIDVWDEARLAEDGFGGILAVGRGSATPPRFVRLDYRPGAPGEQVGPRTARASRGRAGGRGSERPVVLVGKGITYDTGGLSIKPREAMVPMKTDMTGAGAVLSVLAACRALGVTRPVVGLLPLAENAVGGASYRPSDVVWHYGGRRVEVANTDAEGRMVLADALAYADAVLDPAVVVDVATLTGAAGLGLGKRHAALYATDEDLAAALVAAAAASGEQVWRMPLVEEYARALDSDVADLRHVPTDTRIGGGSITAALFLREFAGSRPWAHLDIAGPARADRDEHEVGKGATGFGARLLLHFLEAR